MGSIGFGLDRTPSKARPPEEDPAHEVQIRLGISLAALIEGLQSLDERVQGSCRDAFLALGEVARPSVDAASAAAKDTDYRQRLSAISSDMTGRPIGRRAAAAITEALILIVESDDEHLNASAAKAMATSCPIAVDVLVEMALDNQREKPRRLRLLKAAAHTNQEPRGPRTIDLLSFTDPELSFYAQRVFPRFRAAMDAPVEPDCSVGHSDVVPSDSTSSSESVDPQG